MTINTLLLVNISTHFKEIFRVAQLLKKTTDYQPTIFFQENYNNHENDIKSCQEHNIPYLTIDTLNNKNQSKNATKVTTKNFIKQGLIIIIKYIAKIKVPLWFYNLRYSPLKSAAKFLFYMYKKLWDSRYSIYFPFIREIKCNYINITSLFSNFKIDMIILPEDNIFYLTPILVHYANQKKIPVVIAPFTIANLTEIAESFYTLPGCQQLILANALVSKLFPKWILKYKDRQLMIPIQYTLAYEHLKQVPENPWLPNSSNVDVIAAESQAMMQYYLDSGLRKEKLVLIGSLSDDELFHAQKMKQQLKKEFCEKNNIDAEKPLIVWGVTPNQLDMNRPGFEFSSYKEMVLFILNSILKYKDNYNIILNLHPRICPEDVKFLEHYESLISSQNIVTLIPLSDIYLASCSASIRMAISCGIPVINYNVYHYPYSDFDSIKGVIHLETKTELLSVLDKTCSDSNYYNQLKCYQEQDRLYWSMQDGKCSERLLSLLDSHLSKSLHRTETP